MKSRSQNAKPGYQEYNDFWVRLVLSFPAAIFITRFGQSNSFFSMFILRSHQIALISSMVIAYAVFEYTYRITCYADRKLKWGEYLIFRPLYQLAFGFCGGCLLTFLMAKFYYQAHGINILKTGYIRNLFPIIVGYIALINAYYSWHIISVEAVSLLQKKEKTATKTSKTANAAPSKVQEVSKAKELMQYIIENDVVLISRHTWTCIARNALNKEVDWPYDTINASMAILPADQFIKARSNIIVRGDAIENIKQKKRVHIITLRGLPQIPIQIPKEREVDFIEFGEKYKTSWWDNDTKKFR